MSVWTVGPPEGKALDLLAPFPSVQQEQAVLGMGSTPSELSDPTGGTG